MTTDTSLKVVLKSLGTYSELFCYYCPRFLWTLQHNAGNTTQNTLLTSSTTSCRFHVNSKFPKNGRLPKTTCWCWEHTVDTSTPSTVGGGTKRKPRKNTIFQFCSVKLCL